LFLLSPLSLSVTFQPGAARLQLQLTLGEILPPALFYSLCFNAANKPPPMQMSTLIVIAAGFKQKRATISFSYKLSFD
jgi:hypothetical protein